MYFWIICINFFFILHSTHATRYIPWFNEQSWIKTLSLIYSLWMPATVDLKPSSVGGPTACCGRRFHSTTDAGKKRCWCVDLELEICVNCWLWSLVDLDWRSGGFGVMSTRPLMILYSMVTLAISRLCWRVSHFRLWSMVVTELVLW